MKTATKINLLTTAWILFILVLINVFVFISFMTTAVNMEKSALYQVGADILEDVSLNEPTSAIENKLSKNLTRHSFIRIVLPGNKTAYQVTNDPAFAKKVTGKYAGKKESERLPLVISGQEKQVLVSRIPIKEGNQILGTLEIGKQLTGLEMRKDLLIWIMAGCTIFAVLLSLLGGRWLSSIIMKPIASMIKTMEDIEKSGIPKKINIQNDTNDELHKMAKTFNRMIDRLEKNLEKQSQFVSDASHELKTPLTIIKSYANLLRRHGIQDQEMANEAIEAIYSEATRMQKMTETFLGLASLEGEGTLEIKEINLVTLCQDILKQLKDVYRREIVLHFSERPIMIAADELKMKQVIVILLDNAMKYSHDKIEVILERSGQNVRICVKDHGIGIPENEIENIFERLYRVDKARSRETGGTGLGLYIAKSIVKLHKGTIKINSKEGVGTEVELLLPSNQSETKKDQ